MLFLEKRKILASQGGGRRQGAKRPERARPGPKAPGALFCLAAGGALRAPPGLPNAAAPRRPPHGPRLPCASAPPPAIRRLPEGVERLTRPRRGGGVLRAHGPQNHRRGGGQRPPPLRCGRFAPPPPRRAPRRFRQRQKGSEKPGPTLYGAGRLSPGRKGRGNGSAPLGKAAAHALRAAAASSAPPRATVSRQLRPAVARRPPPA